MNNHLAHLTYIPTCKYSDNDICSLKYDLFTMNITTVILIEEGFTLFSLKIPEIFQTQMHLVLFLF